MNKNLKDCIFISIDKSFLELLKNCLLSIESIYKNHPDIILFYTNLTDNDLKELTQISSNIIPLKNRLKTNELWPIMWHLPESIDPRVFYARFLIWKHPIFKKYKNVLHLDADTILVQNLDYLLSYDDFYIVQDIYNWDDIIFKDINNHGLKKQLKKDGITLWNIAGNAWIFLIPPKYRTLEHYRDIMWLLDSYKQYIKWADQSILNIWIYKNHIDIKQVFDYNFQHRLLLDPTYDKYLATSHIIHFNWVNDQYRLAYTKFLLNILNEDNYINIKKYRDYVHSLSYNNRT